MQTIYLNVNGFELKVSIFFCFVRVYSDVKYSKPTFGLIKTFITKNSWSGIEDYFRQLGECFWDSPKAERACPFYFSFSLLDLLYVLSDMNSFFQHTYSTTESYYCRKGKEYEGRYYSHSYQLL